MESLRLSIPFNTVFSLSGIYPKETDICTQSYEQACLLQNETRIKHRVSLVLAAPLTLFPLTLPMGQTMFLYLENFFFTVTSSHEFAWRTSQYFQILGFSPSKYVSHALRFMPSAVCPGQKIRYIFLSEMLMDLYYLLEATCYILK